MQKQVPQLCHTLSYQEWDLLQDSLSLPPSGSGEVALVFQGDSYLSASGDAGAKEGISEKRRRASKE